MQKNIIWNKDIPEPDSPEYNEPIDEELEKLLTWFIRKRRRIAWTYGYDNTEIYFEGIKEPRKEPYECKVGFIREK